MTSSGASPRAARSRSEADLQADVATLLRYGGLNLDDDSIVRREVSTADATRRRIDIERGLTVFELKNDLRVGRARAGGLEQLAGYVQARSGQLEQRYVGVLTDGAEWYLGSLESDGALYVVSEHLVEPGRERRLRPYCSSWSSRRLDHSEYRWVSSHSQREVESRQGALEAPSDP